MWNTSGLKRGGSRGRPKGALNKATLEIKNFSQRAMSDPAYRAELLARIKAGKAPHMETLLHFYAWGKPKEQIDIDARLSGSTVVVHRQLADPQAVSAVQVIDAELAPSTVPALPAPEKP